MKALVHEGAHDVSVKDVPDARIGRPTDVLVRVTTTNIRGSDLHMYEGRTDMETGRILGHENLGEVIAVGDGVDRVRVGDMVCLPFNISCGFCRNCEAGGTAYCLTTNPDPRTAGAAYGFADMGPHAGGQAELPGQSDVKAYNRQLCALIEQGKADPSWIASHELPLTEAPEGYRHFDARDEGWTKVLPRPEA